LAAFRLQRKCLARQANYKLFKALLVAVREYIHLMLGMTYDER
jgi:hypothetical protein